MQINFPQEEKELIEIWKKNKIFEKSLQNKEKDFVFYEGPPTANAKPGVHHVLARAFKDIVCRYKTMKGYRVERKAGWDIHGLPVEISVEKELGLKNKKEVEEYGIEKFNKKCKESVWRYTREWRKLTERMAYWLDLDNPYITGDPFYMESVFYLLKTIWDKGLLEKGHKVMPYCPRCGTGLSSHELAQGYKKITEPAIFVKFNLQQTTNNLQQLGDEKCGQLSVDSCQLISLLVWTTTPWTLPANVAIAANPNINYILAKKGNDYLILAKDRTNVLGEDYEVIKEIKGKDLVGLEYKPLFGRTATEVSLPQEAYKILEAEFVNTEEGTGLVHIAPAFGQDDIALWREKVGEEFPQPVDAQGKFKPEIKEWAGMFVKQADPLIIKHLKENSLLFKEEPYEHDYPFCWRCNTPLLYYAKQGWFIRTTKVKQQLINNNETINWIPSHLKQGRFGEWLNDLKDWSLSRERYWGTPLPVWQCGECDNVVVVGSREDLKKQKFSTNNYFLLRHGESVANAEEFHCSWPEPQKAPLTENGKKTIQGLIPALRKANIDLMFSSDILRTKETAQIVGEALGIKVEFDERLREVDTGILNGKDIAEAEKYFNAQNETDRIYKRFYQGFPGGEKYSQVTVRAGEFVKDIERKYKDKNILIVSHEILLALLTASSRGYTVEESINHREELRFEPAELKTLVYKQFPYNQEGELDWHRPFIDEVEFFCPKCEGAMKRVPEVIDCWFDSGSMPFAQAHWPFTQTKNKKPKTKNIKPPQLFPADYISEAIDQTRGWFYTLLAISTLLGFEAPYKNVVCLGHILDEKGQKMSKSRGNVVDPAEIMEKYGADSLRWYFFTVNQPQDPKLFREKDVEQCLKKFIMTLWNCFIFYKTYGKQPEESVQKENTAVFQTKSVESKNILDKWILSKLNSLKKEVAEKMEAYDITGTARLIDDFVINQLSLWYVRRSRRRFQDPNDSQDKAEASFVLKKILEEVTGMAAPFVPFISELIYQELNKEAESLHLTAWPEPQEKYIISELEQQMDWARKAVAVGLKIRSQQRIKVRQPLEKCKIKMPKKQPDPAILDEIKEELNVKQVELCGEIEETKGWITEKEEGMELGLYIEISKKLEKEGMLREIVRQVQQMRKKSGLKPEDRIKIFIQGDAGLIKEIKPETENMLHQSRATEIIFQKKENNILIEQSMKVDNKELLLALKKIEKRGKVKENKN